MELIYTQRQQDMGLLNRLEELAEMEGLRRMPEVYKIPADTLAELHAKAEEADVLKHDGSRALSADWDIGDGRMIQTDKIQARDSAGLCLYEDGGAGIFIEDGGNIGVGVADPAEKLHVSGHIQMENGYAVRSKSTGGTVSDMINVWTDNKFYLGPGVAVGDFVFRNGGTQMTLQATTGRLGINVVSPGAMLDVDQSSSSGAIAVMKLDQADVDTQFMDFVGTAASGVLVNSIVNNGDVGSATLAGWVKVYVQDDGNQIADQAYFMPLYTLSA